MALFNYLTLNIICPRCGVETEMEAEFRFGLRDLSHYHIGDQLQWEGMGLKTPETRPVEGNYDDEAYVVCPNCERDFWLIVSVRKDILVGATVDSIKQPYIPDEFLKQPDAVESQALEGKWDPRAYAERMRKSTYPVSAFFLIDSPEAFSRCKQWLLCLQPYGMPDMDDSQYLKDVRNIYQERKEVINFDHEFNLLWQNEVFPGKLRCHFVDKQQYEIELWLPGTIANEIADKFKDGHEGFFCVFMPPAFYD